MSEESDSESILIGLGANLPSAFGEPRTTLSAALACIERLGIVVAKRSSFWKTKPVPESDQPWFVNAVVALEKAPPPRALLECLHSIEEEFGRRRDFVNQARTLDLDLLAYGRVVLDEPGFVVPHPRLAQRAFVLVPLREVVPQWRHPRTGETLEAMIERIPANQTVLPD